MSSAVAASTRVTVRQAVPQERAGVVATVVAAFAQDPAWAFILGEDIGISGCWQPTPGAGARAWRRP
jgi:hypothetical protein